MVKQLHVLQTQIAHTDMERFTCIWHKFYYGVGCIVACTTLCLKFTCTGTYTMYCTSITLQGLTDITERKQKEYLAAVCHKIL